MSGGGPGGGCGGRGGEPPFVSRVTISKEEYESLKRDAEVLRALEGAGVDNWEGYEVALEALD